MTHYLASSTHLDYPAAPVWRILEGAARRWPGQVALVEGDTTVTWSGLWGTANDLAARLRGAGLEPGQVLGLRLRNSVAMAEVYWAAQLAGLTISPVNPSQSESGTAHQLADSGAVAVAESGGDSLVLRPVAVPGGPALGAGALAALPTHGAFAPYEPSDLATAVAHICYTGGTTGAPKGVTVTQRALVCNVLQFAHWMTSAVPARDAEGGIVVRQPGSTEEWPVRLGGGVVVAGAPWFHAMGLGGGLIVPALLGNRSLLLGRFDPAGFLDAVAAEGITSISGAPAMLSALAREQQRTPRDVESVRVVSCGGGPLPAPLAERLTRAFPRAVATQAYGLTEVTMAAVGFPTSTAVPRRPGAVGVPLADTEVRLVPDPGRPGEPGGEILVRGPQVMAGYHGCLPETREVLTDGWLRTGDIGIVDEDGYLRIVDRSKDMLLYKGYNVYPSELEALLRSYEGVREAAVVGAPDPDDGDHPVAFVVVDGSPDLEAIRESVNTSVVHYKRLHAIHATEALPTSALGKVLKTELRARAAELHQAVQA
ncbi:class I adenylate-forming enzyme family protein [Streptomyces sp. NPDC002920]